MKTIVLSVFCLLLSHDVYSAMSEAQMKSALKLLKNVCQPKFKISNEILEGFKSGQFPQQEDVMCYMECVFRTGQLFKDGKVNYDSFRNQMVNLPASFSSAGLVTLEKCKDAATSSDKCVAAHEVYKCFYDDNPSNFFFP